MYFLVNLDQMWECPNSDPTRIQRGSNSHPTRIQLTSNADPTHIQLTSNADPTHIQLPSNRQKLMGITFLETHIKRTSNWHQTHIYNGEDDVRLMLVGCAFDANRRRGVGGVFRHQTTSNAHRIGSRAHPTHIKNRHRTHIESPFKMCVDLGFSDIILILFINYAPS